MRRTSLIVLVALAAGSAATLASDQTIRQKGRVFSPEAVKVKKGDTLTFLNDDNVPHNIMSLSPGNQFDLGAQAPGTSTAVTFRRAGEVNVVCAIHPRMKMTVTVAD